MPTDWLLDRLCLRQQQFKELSHRFSVPFGFRRVRFPIGTDIEHPVRQKMVLRRSRDGMSWQIASGELSDLTAAALLAVTRDRKFAFGVCTARGCRRIFARSVRGRPQKYCSAACKGRGVPSAKKRSQYVSDYRARKREEDLRRVCTLLKRSKNRAERYALLKRKFPGRPAKSILYVAAGREASRRPARNAPEKDALSTKRRSTVGVGTAWRMLAAHMPGSGGEPLEPARRVHWRREADTVRMSAIHQASCIADDEIKTAPRQAGTTAR